MLIKFESKGAAPFVMQGSIAEQLCSMAGLPAGAEGSISGAAIPEALASLEEALAEQSQPSGESDDEEDEVESVSISARSVPLREMMEHAMRIDSYVMWRPE